MKGSLSKYSHIRGKGFHIWILGKHSLVHHTNGKQYLILQTSNTVVPFSFIKQSMILNQLFQTQMSPA